MLFVVILTGCAREGIKTLPPLDEKTTEEESAIFIIPADAKVQRINGAERGWFSSWGVGFWSGTKAAATLPMPAGEHSIIFDYSQPAYGWKADKLECTVTMSAGKMYLLSVTRDEKSEIGIISHVFKAASSFLRDNIIDLIPLIGYLPRPNPEGIVYQINEIDQVAFDRYLLDQHLLEKSSFKEKIGIFLVCILWAGIIHGLRGLGHLIFMGKLSNKHIFATYFTAFGLVAAGILIINYNSSGIISMYLLSTLLIGIGISKWDFGIKRNKSGLDKYNRNDYDGAVSDFNKAIEFAPYNAVYIGNRGLAYSELKDWEKAIADYTEAVRLMPNNGTFSGMYFNNRGAAYSHLKDMEKAIADYTEAVRLKPDDAQFLYNRGNAYYSLKDWKKAIADYTEAVRLEPNNAVYFNNRGNAYSELKDWEKAIADFTEAVRLMPNNDLFKKNLANANDMLKKNLVNAQAQVFSNSGIDKFKNKDYVGAVSDFTEAIKLAPYNAVYFSYRGNAYYSLKDWEKAIVDYTEVVRLMPNNAVYFNYRGLAYSKLKDMEKAIADFNEAVRLEPNNAKYIDNRGDAYYNLKDMKKAAADYAEAVRLEPNGWIKEKLAQTQALVAQGRTDFSHVLKE